MQFWYALTLCSTSFFDHNAFQERPSLSTYLNDYLLQFPGAKVAATPGLEWYSKYTPVTTYIKTMTSDAHALSRTQVDEAAIYISDFINNVLSENEVRLNESGTLCVLRPPMY